MLLKKIVGLSFPVLFFSFLGLTVNCNLEEASQEKDYEKEISKLTKIEIYAVSWNKEYVAGLSPERILKQEFDFRTTVFDRDKLEEIDKALKIFLKKAKSFGPGKTDVRVRMDLYYEDGTVDVICFSEPWILKINNIYYWDPDSDLKVFGTLLSPELGKLFFKRDFELIFDYEEGVVRSIRK